MFKAFQLDFFSSKLSKISNLSQTRTQPVRYNPRDSTLYSPTLSRMLCLKAPLQCICRRTMSARTPEQARPPPCTNHRPAALPASSARRRVQHNGQKFTKLVQKILLSIFFFLLKEVTSSTVTTHWSEMLANFHKYFFKNFQNLKKKEFSDFLFFEMFCFILSQHILDNLLADRPAPRGAAGGAGGDPPAIARIRLLKYLKKRQLLVYILQLQCELKANL